MMIKGISIVLLLFLWFSNVACASNFDIVRPDKEDWVCVDYAINHTRNHDGWVTVAESNSRYFYGESAYKSMYLYPDNSADVYMAYRNESGIFVECEYKIQGNWYDDKTTFYHFFVDGCNTRNYKRLFDNRGMVLY